MKITDIIRQVIDIIDNAEQGDQEQVIAVIDQATAVPPEDDLSVIQQLAGLDCGVDEPEYANEPNEIVASLGAAFPGGDDMHQHKNPADIRTNAPSMFPGFQAGVH